MKMMMMHSQQLVSTIEGQRSGCLTHVRGVSCMCMPDSCLDDVALIRCGGDYQCVGCGVWPNVICSCNKSVQYVSLQMRSIYQTAKQMRWDESQPCMLLLSSTGHSEMLLQQQMMQMLYSKAYRIL